MYKKLFLGLIIFLALSFFIAQEIDFPKLNVLLAQFPKLGLLFLLCLSLLITFLKSWRFNILLKNSQIDLSFWRTLKVFIASQATTQLPGGELGRGIILKKETAISMSRSAGVVVSQALIEFLSASLIAIVGSFFYRDFLGISLFGTAIFSIVMVVILHKEILPIIAQWLSRFDLLRRYKDRFILSHKLLRENIFGKKGSIPRRGFFVAVGIGLLSHIAGALLLFYVARFLGIQLGLPTSLFIYSSSILVTLFASFSPGGLGFTEGAMTGLLVAEGIPITQTVAVVLIFRAFTLALSSFIGLIYVVLFYSRLTKLLAKLGEVKQLRQSVLMLLKVMLLVIFNLASAYVIGNIIVDLPFVKAFDTSVYEMIHKGPHPYWLDQIIRPLNFNFLPREWGFTFPSFFYIWIGAFLIYLAIRRRKDVFWALLALLLGGYFATQLFAFTDHYVERERPFITNENRLDSYSKKVWEDWPTFPSGHARETAIFAFITASFMPSLTITLILFSLFIAFSRVYLGAHYPTDSLAGLLMGFLAGYAVIITVSHIRYLFEKRRKHGSKKDR